MTRPGIPDTHKDFDVITDDVVVVIFEQGLPPHPGPLDRLYLYIRVNGTFVKMGAKNRIPVKFDVRKWVRQSLKARAHVREEALKRLHLEVKEHQEELAALNAAIGEL